MEKKNPTKKWNVFKCWKYSENCILQKKQLLVEAVKQYVTLIILKYLHGLFHRWKKDETYCVKKASYVFSKDFYRVA